MYMMSIRMPNWLSRGTFLLLSISILTFLMIQRHRGPYFNIFFLVSSPHHVTVQNVHYLHRLQREHPLLALITPSKATLDVLVHSGTSQVSNPSYVASGKRCRAIAAGIVNISSVSACLLLITSGGQSIQIKYLSKSTDTYNKILLQ